MSMPTENPNAYEAPESQPEKKPKGCMFYGCLIVGIGTALLLLLMIGGGVGGYFFLKGQVDKYTSTEPVEIPVAEATEEEVAEIQSRIDRLQQAVEADEPAAEREVVLTADDLNALIASQDDLKGRVFVRIEGDQIAGDVSIPLDDVPMGKGRYLNASATFDASYQDGVPIVTLKDAVVKGQPLPQSFIDAMAQENLAKDMLKDPEVAEKFRKFESIEVRDGKIILKLKAADESDAPDLPETEPAPPEPVGAE